MITKTREDDIQKHYNPTAYDAILPTGRNALSRDEAFRISINLKSLKQEVAGEFNIILLSHFYLLHGMSEF